MRSLLSNFFGSTSKKQTEALDSLPGQSDTFDLSLDDNKPLNTDLNHNLIITSGFDWDDDSEPTTSGIQNDQTLHQADIDSFYQSESKFDERFENPLRSNNRDPLIDEFDSPIRERSRKSSFQSLRSGKKTSNKLTSNSISPSDEESSSKSVAISNKPFSSPPISHQPMDSDLISISSVQSLSSLPSETESFLMKSLQIPSKSANNTASMNSSFPSVSFSFTHPGSWALSGFQIDPSNSSSSSSSSSLSSSKTPNTKPLVRMVFEKYSTFPYSPSSPSSSLTSTASSSSSSPFSFSKQQQQQQQPQPQEEQPYISLHSFQEMYYDFGYYFPPSSLASLLLSSDAFLSLAHIRSSFTQSNFTRSRSRSQSLINTRSRSDSLRPKEAKGEEEEEEERFEGENLKVSYEVFMVWWRNDDYLSAIKLSDPLFQRRQICIDFFRYFDRPPLPRPSESSLPITTNSSSTIRRPRGYVSTSEFSVIYHHLLSSKLICPPQVNPSKIKQNSIANIATDEIERGGGGGGGGGGGVEHIIAILQSQRQKQIKRINKNNLILHSREKKIKNDEVENSDDDDDEDEDEIDQEMSLEEEEYEKKIGKFIEEKDRIYFRFYMKWVVSDEVVKNYLTLSSSSSSSSKRNSVTKLLKGLVQKAKSSTSPSPSTPSSTSSTPISPPLDANQQQSNQQQPAQQSSHPKPNSKFSFTKNKSSTSSPSTPASLPSPTSPSQSSTSSSDSTTSSSPLLVKVKDHPSYAKYLKLSSQSSSSASMKRRMMEEGLDPKLLDNLDTLIPAPTTLIVDSSHPPISLDDNSPSSHPSTPSTTVSSPSSMTTSQVESSFPPSSPTPSTPSPVPPPPPPPSSPQLSSQPAPPSNSPRPPPPSGPPPRGTPPSNPSPPPTTDVDYPKYQKMLTMLPEGAVRQKMRNDGVNDKLIDDFIKNPAKFSASSQAPTSQPVVAQPGPPPPSSPRPPPPSGPPPGPPPPRGPPASNSSSPPTTSPSPSDVDYPKYQKMLTMLPEGAVRQKMRNDGVNDKLIDDFIKNPDKFSASSLAPTSQPAPAPPPPNSPRPPPPSGPPPRGPPPPPSNPSPPPTTSPSPSDVDYPKYQKMLTMLPEGAVRQKMRNDGVNDKLIDEFIKNPEKVCNSNSAQPAPVSQPAPPPLNPPRPPPPGPPPRGPPPPPPSNIPSLPPSTTSTASPSDVDYPKYLKMLTMLPEGAVRQKMRNDGVNDKLIDDFFKNPDKFSNSNSAPTSQPVVAQPVAPPSNSPRPPPGPPPGPPPRPPPPNPLSSTSTPSSLAEVDYPKYLKMLTMLPEGAVRQKMRNDGVNDKLIDEFIKNPEKVSNSNSAQPAPVSQPGPPPPNSPRPPPPGPPPRVPPPNPPPTSTPSSLAEVDYPKYLKMLTMLPEGAVRQKMRNDGVNDKLIDDFIKNPHNITKFPTQSSTAPTSNPVPPSSLTPRPPPPRGPPIIPPPPLHLKDKDSLSIQSHSSLDSKLKSLLLKTPFPPPPHVPPPPSTQLPSSTQSNPTHPQLCLSSEQIERYSHFFSSHPLETATQLMKNDGINGEMINSFILNHVLSSASPSASDFSSTGSSSSRRRSIFKSAQYEQLRSRRESVEQLHRRSSEVKVSKIAAKFDGSNNKNPVNSSSSSSQTQPLSSSTNLQQTPSSLLHEQEVSHRIEEEEEQQQLKMSPSPFSHLTLEQQKYLQSQRTSQLTHPLNNPDSQSSSSSSPSSSFSLISNTSPRPSRQSSQVLSQFLLETLRLIDLEYQRGRPLPTTERNTTPHTHPASLLTSPSSHSSLTDFSSSAPSLSSISSESSLSSSSESSQSNSLSAIRRLTFIKSFEEKHQKQFQSQSTSLLSVGEESLEFKLSDVNECERIRHDIQQSNKGISSHQFYILQQSNPPPPSGSSKTTIPSSTPPPSTPLLSPSQIARISRPVQTDLSESFTDPTHRNTYLVLVAEKELIHQTIENMREKENQAIQQIKNNETKAMRRIQEEEAASLMRMKLAENRHEDKISRKRIELLQLNETIDQKLSLSKETYQQQEREQKNNIQSLLKIARQLKDHSLHLQQHSKISLDQQQQSYSLNSQLVSSSLSLFSLHQHEKKLQQEEKYQQMKQNSMTIKKKKNNLKKPNSPSLPSSHSIPSSQSEREWREDDRDGEREGKIFSGQRSPHSSFQEGRSDDDSQIENSVNDHEKEEQDDDNYFNEKFTQDDEDNDHNEGEASFHSSFHSLRSSALPSSSTSSSSSQDPLKLLKQHKQITLRLQQQKQQQQEHRASLSRSFSLSLSPQPSSDSPSFPLSNPAHLFSAVHSPSPISSSSSSHSSISSSDRPRSRSHSQVSFSIPPSSPSSRPSVSPPPLIPLSFDQDPPHPSIFSSSPTLSSLPSPSTLTSPIQDELLSSLSLSPTSPLPSSSPVLGPFPPTSSLPLSPFSPSPFPTSNSLPVPPSSVSSSAMKLFASIPSSPSPPSPTSSSSPLSSSSTVSLSKQELKAQIGDLLRGRGGGRI